MGGCGSLLSVHVVLMSGAALEAATDDMRAVGLAVNVVKCESGFSCFQHGRISRVDSGGFSLRCRPIGAVLKEFHILFEIIPTCMSSPVIQ